MLLLQQRLESADSTAVEKYQSLTPVREKDDINQGNVCDHINTRGRPCSSTAITMLLCRTTGSEHCSLDARQASSCADAASVILISAFLLLSEAPIHGVETDNSAAAFTEKLKAHPTTVRRGSPIVFRRLFA